MSAVAFYTAAMQRLARATATVTALVVAAAVPAQALVVTPMDGGVCWLDGSAREIADYATAHRYITAELEARVREDAQSDAARTELAGLDATAFAFDPALPPEELFGEGELPAVKADLALAGYAPDEVIYVLASKFTQDDPTFFHLGYLGFMVADGQFDPHSQPSDALLAAVGRADPRELKRYTDFYYQAQMAAVDATTMCSQGRTGYVVSPKWDGSRSEGARVVSSQSSVPATSSAVRWHDVVVPLLAVFGLGVVATAVLPQLGVHVPEPPGF